MAWLLAKGLADENVLFQPLTPAEVQAGFVTKATEVKKKLVEI